MVLSARGPEQQSHGVDNVLAFINLVLALGKAGKPNCGYGCLTGQGNGQGGREHGQKADQLPGYRKIDNPKHRAEIAVRLGRGPGLAARAGTFRLRVAGRPRRARCAACWCSPRTSSYRRRSAKQLVERIDRLDLLVVADLFLSETAARADVVLPVAQWAEEEGTMTNLEGRVLLRRRVKAPPPGVWTDAADTEGARRPARIAARISPAARPRSSPNFAARRAGGVADYAGVTYGRIAAEEGVFWPCPDETHPGTPRMFLDSFAHEDGRARFQAVEYRGAAEQPNGEYPFILTTGRAARALPVRARKPAACRSCMRRSRTHSSRSTPIRRACWASRQATWSACETRRGAAELKLRISRDIRPDTLFVPFHWGGKGSANLLTNAALDPVSRIPEFKVCAVRLEKINAGHGRASHRRRISRPHRNELRTS